MVKLKPSIDYTSKDYEAFRSDLLGIIPLLMPEYTDLSESDAGVMMVELNAYIGDILSYYQDRRANEVYLPTATQRQSVLDITSGIGYTLRNATPSRSTLVVELTAPAKVDFVVPKGFSVATAGTEYEEPITFETTVDLVIPKGAVGTEQDEKGNYLYKVPVVQGITILNEVLGSSNGLPQQKLQLHHQSVIDGSTNVYIDEGAGFELWTDVTDDTVGATESGKQYTRETDEDGYTWIVLGDGLNGKIPAIGIDNIVCSYRVGGGLDTNVGTGSITEVNMNLAGIKSVTNPEPATGGLDAETLDEAKVNAPKMFKSQARAVTTEDYENISTSVPGVAKAKAVVDETMANTVHIIIAPDGGGQPTVDLVNEVEQVLDERKVITTNVLMEPPRYVLARLGVDFTINSEWNPQEVRSYVMESLKTLFDFSTMDFGVGMPISKVYQALTQVQGVYSLTVNRMTMKPTIEWVQVSGNPTFSNVDTLTAADYDGYWKVEMTSATAFKVSRLSYDAEGNEILVPKGTGTMGTLFKDTDNMLQFTLTAGSLANNAGDYWRIRTIPYFRDISVGPYEILMLDEETLDLTFTGGVANV